MFPRPDKKRLVFHGIFRFFGFYERALGDGISHETGQKSSRVASFVIVFEAV